MIPRLRLALIGLVAALSAAGPARPGVLVELFTSQGCSSCPPADALLSIYADAPEVVALAFHVDYWDRLGWPDRFGSPAHTLRQRAYGRAWARRTIYTPQFVVQGLPDAPETGRRGIDQQIGAAAAGSGQALIAVEPAGAGRVLIRLTPGAGSAAAATLRMARYTRRAEVEIRAGENAGRTLAYRNVARTLETFGTWDGTAPETRELAAPGPGEGLAVWLETGPGGPVLAAAKFEP